MKEGVEGGESKCTAETAIFKKNNLKRKRRSKEGTMENTKAVVDDYRCLLQEQKKEKPLMEQIRERRRQSFCSHRRGMATMVHNKIGTAGLS